MKNPGIAVLAVLLVIIGAASLAATEIDHSWGINFAYYVDDNRGGAPGSSWFQLPSYVPKEPEDSAAWLGGPYAGFTEEETRNLGSGWGSLELEGYYRFRAVMPFLQGDGALFADNNLTFIVKPIVSPATLHLETEVQWTPIAFIKVLAGVAGGTGWALSPLGVEGLALNMSDDITDTERGGWAGLYFLGTTLQFDLAAIVPGEWNHIVLSATGKARYAHYSKAGDLESWYWRGDAGKNFNGWEYRGDYAIGWQPPWKVNFIGIIAEHQFWISSDIRNLAPIDNTFVAYDPDGQNWGSDFHHWRFGPAVNIDLSKGNNLTILLQLRNGLYLTEETAYARWYQRWETTGEKYIKLDRLALAYSKKY